MHLKYSGNASHLFSGSTIVLLRFVSIFGQNGGEKMEEESEFGERRSTRLSFRSFSDIDEPVSLLCDNDNIND